MSVARKAGSEALRGSTSGFRRPAQPPPALCLAWAHTGGSSPGRYRGSFRCCASYGPISRSAVESARPSLFRNRAHRVATGDRRDRGRRWGEVCQRTIDPLLLRVFPRELSAVGISNGLKRLVNGFTTRRDGGAMAVPGANDAMVSTASMGALTPLAFPGRRRQARSPARSPPIQRSALGQRGCGRTAT